MGNDRKAQLGTVLVVLALIVALPWRFGLAAEAPHTLYTAQVPVATGDEKDRKAGIAAALQKVLVKLTGRRDVAEAPSARALLDHAERWVAEYRYLAPQADAQGYLLAVRFQPEGLRRALQKAGLPVWPTPRPSVLAWVAIDEGRARRFLEEDDPALEAALRTAQERGVNLILPLLDLEDRSRIQPADVLGGFDEDVRQAAERYAPDGVLIVAGHTLGNGTWRFDWRLYLADSRLEWRSQAAALTQALVEGIHMLADRLAHRFTPPAGQTVRPGRVLIAVEAVDSMEAFMQVRRYLGQSTVLQQVQPWRLAPGTAVFRASASSDPASVARALAARGGPLQPLPEAGGLETVDGQLVPLQHYRWLPSGAPTASAQPAH